ncbi:MAG: hypothetical protein QOI66_4601 [Myxococcales bacterium]|jgi:hypothetical protein|nr:hypothetical protein [Myxococcales bacterium]
MFDRFTRSGALAALAVVACHRTAPPPAATLALPDVLAGFTASAGVGGDNFVRRRYTRAAVHIDVTLARAAPLGTGTGGFAAWLEMSRAGFPQASLDAPSDDANGFYQCTAGAPSSCDLLIQMRSGVHLELRGGGTSSRADVDDIARALPLRALAALPIDANSRSR